jgi:His-Xaa-Ser system protein HxsD
MEPIQKLENGQILLRVDKNIHNHEAILSTAYKFTENCHIQITSLDSNCYGVYFSSKNPNTDLSSQVNDFCNELIDQQLRYNLDKSNKSIKELVIKKAFFPFQDNE